MGREDIHGIARRKSRTAPYSNVDDTLICKALPKRALVKNGLMDLENGKAACNRQLVVEDRVCLGVVGTNKKIEVSGSSIDQWAATTVRRIRFHGFEDVLPARVVGDLRKRDNVHASHCLADQPCPLRRTREVILPIESNLRRVFGEQKLWIVLSRINNIE